jgi:hypothetical protein
VFIVVTILKPVVMAESARIKKLYIPCNRVINGGLLNSAKYRKLLVFFLLTEKECVVKIIFPRFV